MAEVINTAYSPGDTVWYVDRATYEATNSIVLQVQVNVTNVTEIKYKLGETDWRTEDKVFASREDLAASFNPL